MSISEPGFTGSVSPPYPPAPSEDWSSPYPPAVGDEPRESESTTELAKQEASNVAQSASGAAQQVAGTTKEQAANVASDAKYQAKQLAQQTRQELSQQVSTGKERAVSGLRALSQELGSMSDGTEESGPATQLVRQARSTTDRVADFVEQREPGQILDEVRDFARRRPGTFLLGALVAGVVVGRLTRGAVSSASGGSEDSSEQSQRQGNGEPRYGQPPPVSEATPAYGTPAPTGDPLLPAAGTGGPGAYGQAPPTYPGTGYGHGG